LILALSLSLLTVESKGIPPIPSLAQQYVAQYQFGFGNPRFGNFSGLFAGTIAINWEVYAVMLYLEDDAAYNVPWQFQTTLISHPDKQSPTGVDVYQTFSESRCWYLGENNLVIDFLIGVPLQIPEDAVFYENTTVGGQEVEIWQWNVDFIGNFDTELGVRASDGAIVYYSSSPFSYYNTNIQQVNNVASSWFAKPEGQCVNPPYGMNPTGFLEDIILGFLKA